MSVLFVTAAEVDVARCELAERGEASLALDGSGAGPRLRLLPSGAPAKGGAKLLGQIHGRKREWFGLGFDCLDDLATCELRVDELTHADLVLALEDLRSRLRAPELGAEVVSELDFLILQLDVAQVELDRRRDDELLEEAELLQDEEVEACVRADGADPLAAAVDEPRDRDPLLLEEHAMEERVGPAADGRLARREVVGALDLSRVDSVGVEEAADVDRARGLGDDRGELGLLDDEELSLGDLVAEDELLGGDDALVGRAEGRPLDRSAALAVERREAGRAIDACGNEADGDRDEAEAQRQAQDRTRAHADSMEHVEDLQSLPMLIPIHRDMGTETEIVAFALVDECDFQRLSMGVADSRVVHHVNANRLDNRRANLLALGQVEHAEIEGALRSKRAAEWKPRLATTDAGNGAMA